MSYTIIGKELPVGTIVYFYPNDNTVWRSTIDGHGFTDVNFIFDHRDGLYASKSVRMYWERCPMKHPHITLFNLLLAAL